MRDIKSIELVFENCESVTFERNVIGTVNIEDIKRVFRRIACNSISSYTTAETVAIEIFADGNAEYDPFKVDDKERVFDRIARWIDITYIVIGYENGDAEELYVDYDSGEKDDMLGAPNVNQKTYLSDLGNLYIIISAKDVNFEDQFGSKEELNDSERNEFIKEMYDIGIKEEPYHEYSAESLPDMYRYVYLADDTSVALAVRVFDKNSGWKFVFQEPNWELNFPTKWKYLESNIEEYVNKTHDGFSIEEIRKKYPPDNNAIASYLINDYQKDMVAGGYKKR